jgi:DHA1 family multidrug resistance protein-like MFS transporter
MPMPHAAPTIDSEPHAHRNDWRALLVLFTAAGVVESQAFGHLNAFTPLFLEQLHVPAAQIPSWTGILAALGFVIGLPLLPFWGVWADRYGRKLIIVRSAYVEMVVFSLVALSPNVWVLAVGRLLSGFVLGNTGVMLALLADVTPRKRLGLAVGIASAGFPLGSAIGPFVGGLIAEGPGIRTLLLLDALLSGLMGLILTLGVREEPRIAAVSGTVTRLLRQAVHDITSSPTVVRLFVVYFMAMFALSLTTPFVPILLQRLYVGPTRLLPGVVGGTLAGAGLAMAITTPLWGRLGDLIGRWTVLPICLTALLIGLCAATLAPALPPLQATIVAVGLFQGAVGTTIIALLALLAPEQRRASILNFALLPSQLAWFLAPITGAGLVAVSAVVLTSQDMVARVPFAAGTAAMLLASALALRLSLREARGERAARQPADASFETGNPREAATTSRDR